MRLQVDLQRATMQHVGVTATVTLTSAASKVCMHHAALLFLHTMALPLSMAGALYCQVSWCSLFAVAQH